jgi:hypothetical protein
MRKIILVAVLIVLAGIYFQRATVIALVMERGMDSRMDSNILDSLEDGLHVALCGAGGPDARPQCIRSLRCGRRRRPALHRGCWYLMESGIWDVWAIRWEI